MGLRHEIREWWLETLLEEQASAHPIFGANLRVDVDGEVVTLSGTMPSVEQVQEVVREAKNVDSVRVVVNHLVVEDTGRQYQQQTVVAVFPSLRSAELGSRAVEASTLHEEEPPTVLRTPEEVRETLGRRLRAAQVPNNAMERYVQFVHDGKALLVDRVPEDDALRIISALEGTSAEMIRTLPPEPGSQAQ